MISELGLNVFNLVPSTLEEEVSSLYCGDLLSDVMGHIQPGAVWFTIQGHINSVAVAQLKDVLCIVLVNGVEPDSQSLEKAQYQGICMLGSKESSADLCIKYAQVTMKKT